MKRCVVDAHGNVDPNSEVCCGCKVSSVMRAKVVKLLTQVWSR